MEVMVTKYNTSFKEYLDKTKQYLKDIVNNLMQLRKSSNVNNLKNSESSIDIGN